MQLKNIVKIQVFVESMLVRGLSKFRCLGWYKEDWKPAKLMVLPEELEGVQKLSCSFTCIGRP